MNESDLYSITWITLKNIVKFFRKLSLLNRVLKNCTRLSSTLFLRLKIVLKTKNGKKI